MMFAVFDRSPLTLCINCSFFLYIPNYQSMTYVDVQSLQSASLLAGTMLGVAFNKRASHSHENINDSAAFRVPTSSYRHSGRIRLSDPDPDSQ